MNFLDIAAFNSFVPEAGVYFVNPSLIALIAASQIFSGVLKSGSPAPNPTTSFPCALSSFAFAVIARVDEGLTAAAFFDNSNDIFLTSFLRLYRISNLIFLRLYQNQTAVHTTYD